MGQRGTPRQLRPSAGTTKPKSSEPFEPKVSESQAGEHELNLKQWAKEQRKETIEV